jgi:hypothetical protein
MGKTSLRLGFMNTENLFSPGIKFYKSEYTPEQYEEKVEWIGRRIAELQVHVCAFTEVGENPDTCMQDVMDIANKHSTTEPQFSKLFLAEPQKISSRL